MHTLRPSFPISFGSAALVCARLCLPPVLTIAAIGLAGLERARAAEAADSAGLGPTSAVPWNPPAAVAASLPWESALRFPGRVATLPLSGLGALSRRTLLVVEEKSIVPRVQVALQVLPRAGIVIAPAALGDRTGFGARLLLAPPPLDRYGELEYSGTTRQYTRTRAALFAGPARLEYRREWRPEERFFGLGMAARLDDTTGYSTTHESLTFSLTRGFRLEAAGRPVRLAAGAWAGGRGIGLARGREEEVTPIEAVSPGPGGSAFFVGGTQWIGGASLSLDTREGRPHWSRGGRVAVTVERAWDRDDGRLLLLETSGRAPSDHRRIRSEIEAAVSFWRDPRTLRLLARAERLAPGDDSRVVALSDLPALGGSEGLAGFEPGRFRDRASVLARLAYIFPLAQHFEMDAHVEAGGVFPGIEAARMDRLEASYGALLRPRLPVAPLGAFGVEWSREGVRALFSIGSVE